MIKKDILRNKDKSGMFKPQCVENKENRLHGE